MEIILLDKALVEDYITSWNSKKTFSKETFKLMLHQELEKYLFEIYFINN